jgi:hypothetical protein
MSRRYQTGSRVGSLWCVCEVGICVRVPTAAWRGLQGAARSRAAFLDARRSPLPAISGRAGWPSYRPAGWPLRFRREALGVSQLTLIDVEREKIGGAEVQYRGYVQQIHVAVTAGRVEAVQRRLVKGSEFRDAPVFPVSPNHGKRRGGPKPNPAEICTSSNRAGSSDRCPTRASEISGEALQTTVTAQSPWLHHDRSPNPSAYNATAPHVAPRTP